MKNQTPTNFTNLITLSKNFTDEAVCRQYLEHIIWDGSPTCPHCGSLKYYAFKDGKRYKCADKKCRKQYNIKVGTFLEGTKLPLCKWFHALYVFSSHKKGISSHQLGKDLGITQKSAWFVLSRLREILREKAPFVVDGMVEVDTTWIGGKDANKHRSKKEYNASGFSIDKKIPVLGIVQREGKVSLKPIAKSNVAIVLPLIKKHIVKGSTMVTDSAGTFRQLGYSYKHGFVNHSKGEYVRGQFHTNSVEGVFSHLKRGIVGIYHHTSKQHLRRYCNEFAFRYNTRKCTEVERFNIALTQIKGRLTYETLIKKRDWV